MSEQNQPEPGRSKRWAKLGIILILISGIFWFSIFAIPFLPLTTGAKAITAGILFAGVQAAWWSGAALAGPETVKKIRGWFSRRKSSHSGKSNRCDRDRDRKRGSAKSKR